ncbi:MAG: glycosyltransferase [Fibrobacter sp.]|nr:glycosyltransferase [Fibrobacter sp.]
MHQKDLSLLKTMNVHSNFILANQSDENTYIEKSIDGFSVKMISTTTRGVGLNRNIALSRATKDVLLFADDDTVFENDLEEKVVGAFEKNPMADVILFGMRYVKDGVEVKRVVNQNKEIPFYKSFKYGAVNMAVRRSALLRKNLSFSQLFGGGCIYSHGEDSNFIIDCFNRKLRVFTNSYVVGCTDSTQSSWFRGFSEKYFYDAGALARSMFGLFSYPYMLYMALRTKKRSNLSFVKKMKMLYAGYVCFDKLISYEEYKNTLLKNK